MYNLFNLMAPAGQGVHKDPAWLYVRDGLKRSLGTVISYYRKHPMAVQSSHFLVRLLHSITVPQSMNLERYYDNVDAMALNMSMALKMTSPIYRGHLFDGVFYGQDCPEVLIAHTDAFDPFEAHRNWQNLCPVKVLRHPKSDLGMNLPDGTHSGSETGLAVIAINIPMLAIQYRAFRLNEEMLADINPESQRSIMQFIHMYVLPNMLFSHLDIALFNRMENHRKGAPLGETTKQHPFYLTDFTDKVDRVQEGILHNLQRAGKDFTGILRSVPLVTKDTLERAMALPDVAPTRQVLWGLVLARLPILTFLFSVLEDGPGMRSRTEVNRVLRAIQQWKTDQLLRTMLPVEEYLFAQDEIDNILSKV
jgi:hypothetical protein